MDNFCPECGQKNSELKIGFGTLVLDFLGDVFTFDSKIFKSLWYLVSKPGLLTKEFNDGKRARFIPPLRMFLILGVLTFSLFSALYDPAGEVAQGFKDATLDSRSSTSKINIERNHEKEKELSEGLTDEGSENTIHFTSTLLTDAQIDTLLSKVKNDSLSVEQVVDSLHLESFPAKVIATQVAKVARSGPRGFVSWVINNFTLVVLFMVPLFALLLKLLYLRKKHVYMDHLIFSLHQHSLIYVAMLPLIFIGARWLALVLFLIVLPAYTFFAMQRVYGESVFNTLWKQLFSGVSYAFVSIFVLAFFLLLGFIVF